MDATDTTPSKAGSSSMANTTTICGSILSAILEFFWNSWTKFKTMICNDTETRRLQDELRKIQDEKQKLHDKLEEEKKELTREMELLSEEKKQLVKRNAQVESNLQVEEEHVKSMENQLKKKEIDAKKTVSKMNTTILELKQELVDLQKLKGMLPSTKVAVGAYELGGVNPTDISDHWRSMYSNLSQTFSQVFNSLSQYDSSSAAEMEFRHFVHELSQQDAIKQYLFVVREVSSVLSRLIPSAIINDDGSFICFSSPNLLEILTEETPHVTTTQQFAKDLLRRLPPPTVNSAPPFFDGIPSAIKNILAFWFDNIYEDLKQKVGMYFVENELVNSTLKTFLYTAIYTAIERFIIGDNTIMAYWSSCSMDLNLFKIRHPNEHTQIRQMKALHLNVETVKIRSPIPISENPSRLVVFTVFPGCAHFDSSGKHEVFSPGFVVCGDPVTI